MGGRRKESGAIQFASDFDHVEVARTVAYKAGDIVAEPSAELLAAAGERVAPFVEPEPVTDPLADGE